MPKRSWKIQPPVTFEFAFCVFLSAIGRKFDEWKEKENVT